MEPHPRTALCTGGLRSLANPKPARVEARDGKPVAVQRNRPGSELQPVVRIEDNWRIVDEWWRPHPIARTYYRVTLEDGRTLTLYHDDTHELTTAWFEQVY